MFGLGVPELVIIALILLLLFGAKQEQEEETKSGEDTGSEKKSIESKLADKVIDRVPGIGQARKIKDKAEKIKKIVS
jgi:Sec-independent protein translocase protein TatA